MASGQLLSAAAHLPRRRDLEAISAYLAAATLGLLAGAMLLIATAIVPFWSSLELAEFARWFERYSPLLGRVMLPLGAASTLLSLLAAALVRPLSSPRLPWFASAAALARGTGLAPSQASSPFSPL